MSTDTLLGLDGAPLADRPHAYRVVSRDTTADPPRRRRRADIEAQLERLSALMRDGFVVRVGKSGT